MNRAERMASRGDRSTAADPPIDKIRALVGPASERIARWFQQTGNRPADCDVSSTASATATALTLTLTITKGA